MQVEASVHDHLLISYSFVALLCAGMCVQTGPRSVCSGVQVKCGLDDMGAGQHKEVRTQIQTQKNMSFESSVKDVLN